MIAVYAVHAEGGVTPQVPLPAAESTGGRASFRRRLQWLLAGRLVVATLLMGGTLLLNVEDLSSFTSFTPRLLMYLIASSYTLSLAFAVWLPRAARLGLVAAAQIGADLLLTTGLVYAAGGVASGFTFLYGTTILMAALIVGPRASVAVAVFSLLLYSIVGVSEATGWLPHPPDQPSWRYLLPAPDIGLSALTNLVGLTLVTALAATLAARLRRAGGELERATERSARIEKLTDDIVQSLTSGLITADLAGRIRSINPAGLQMLCAEEADVADQPLSTFLPRSSGAEPGGRSDGVAVRPDGSTFPVGYTRTPLVGAGGQETGTLVVFQDLTEISELKAAAERAERLAALGKLSAGLAHEIRNPLSSISGSVQLVHDNPRLSDEDRRLLRIVVSEVERLNDLVTTMIDVGRPRKPHPVAIDLARLASQVVEMACRGPAHALGVQIAPIEALGPALAWADVQQMRQVLWNLLKNALQASPPGGSVHVRVRAIDAEHVAIEVEDEGAGIDASDRARLFDMFYSIRPGGVGLGLALVRQIVDGHGGSIEVESEPGHGAIFRVILAAPVTASPSHAGEPALQ